MKEKEVVNKYNLSIERKGMYGEEKAKFGIDIRLDNSLNGRYEFAMTGAIYEDGKPKIDKYRMISGAISDYIAKEFPEFEIFEELHLCDINGVPSGDLLDLGYWMRKGDKDIIKRFGLTDEECDAVIPYREEYLYIIYKLNKMGYFERRKKLAEEGIKKLEEMTGTIFESVYKDSNDENRFRLEYHDLSKAEELEKEGFFELEAFNKRMEEEHKKEIEKLRKEAKKNFNVKMTKLKREYEIEMAIIDSGITSDNYIFYDFNHLLVFNWKEYSDQIKDEEVERFKEFVKGKPLFNDIIIENRK